MKRIILLGIVIFISTACKKGYTCTCITTYVNGAAPVTTQTGIRDTKLNAITACTNEGLTVSGTENVSCSIYN